MHGTRQWRVWWWMIAIAAGCTGAGCAGSDAPGELATAQDVVGGGAATTARPEIGVLGTDCTATLIGSRYILTASHCLGFSSTARLGVGFAITGSAGATTAAVDRIHLFGAIGSSTFPAAPHGTEDRFGNDDLALAELAAPVPASLATPATLATLPPTGGPSTIYGFGCTSRSQTCALTSKRAVTYTYGNPTQALTAGDSGGPNLEGFGAANDAVWGVNSGPDFIGNDVFASVSYFKNQILKVIENWNSTDLEVGVIRFGTDVSVVNVGAGSHAAACQSACKLSPACRAFTYTASDGQCHLKDQVAEWGPCETCTSGLAPTIEAATDRVGGTYQSLTLGEDRAELCAAACGRDTNCQAYAYTASTRLCALKTAAAAAPSTSATTVAGAPRAIEVGFDRPGRDIGQPVVAGNPRQCAAACATVSACQAFSFVATNPANPNAGGNCFLKSAQPLAVGHAGVISGARRGLDLNTDRPGLDIDNFDTFFGPESCQAACAIHGNCQSWAYTPPGAQVASAHCWLKSGIPVATRVEHVVSGIKGAEFF